MPDALRLLAEGAKRRHQKRAAIPEVRLPSGPVERLECPYIEGDWELWVCLLLECFGTRTVTVGAAFMRQLADLCPEVLYDGEEVRRRNDAVLEQALAIVASLKPRSEAEAALAAQAVALHLTSMKVGKELACRSYPDPRTVASLAGVTKAYAATLDTMRRLKGGNTTRQTFRVEKHVHYHDERHVHFRRGGRKSGSQPDATEGKRARANHAAEPQERPALSGPQSVHGEVMPFSSREREADMPHARVGSRIGSPEG